MEPSWVDSARLIQTPYITLILHKRSLRQSLCTRFVLFEGFSDHGSMTTPYMAAPIPHAAPPGVDSLRKYTFRD